MDNKKVLPNNVTIKTEPTTPGSTPKKLLLATSFAQLTGKTVSNTRLASFKPPRDLLLTGSTTGFSNTTFNLNSNAKSTKRTFTPNINVTRRKGANDTSLNDVVDSNQKLKDKDKNKRPPSKKRNVNVVQTKGVFSEGLAPGKVKAFGSASSERSYNDRPVLDKPKLNLNKRVSKHEEDSKLKSILKDDLIEDPCLVPDTNFIPNCLPIVYNVNKSEGSGDLEKTFETLQVKTEKISNVKLLKNEKPDISSMFDCKKSPKLFLFEFPNLIEQKEDPSSERKKGGKGQSTEADKQTSKPEGLSSLGEGFLGYLRIHENGQAYLTAGKTIIPLCYIRHVTRQEIMSAGLESDKSKGEVISLGTVDANFTCSANLFQDVR